MTQNEFFLDSLMCAKLVVRETITCITERSTGVLRALTTEEQRQVVISRAESEELPLSESPSSCFALREDLLPASARPL